MASFKTCEFSESLEQSGGQVQFSPQGTHIACASGSRLTIRTAESLEVVQNFPCIDKIDRIEWSPDGEFVFCLLLLRSSVQVFSVTDSQWRCRVNEGVAGLVSAKWSPDSRHIILESDFGIQLSIWSLLTGTSQLILHPKTTTALSATASLIAFSNCSKYHIIFDTILNLM
jgi:WD40 repeat protein